MAEYFEATIDNFSDDPQLVSNWILSEVIAVLNRENIEINTFQIKPGRLASLLSRIQDNTISSKIAKDLFNQMLTNDKTVDGEYVFVIVTVLSDVANLSVTALILAI